MPHTLTLALAYKHGTIHRTLSAYPQVEGYEGKYIAGYIEQIVPTAIAYLYHGTSLVFRFLPLCALSMAKGGCECNENAQP